MAIDPETIGTRLRRSLWTPGGQVIGVALATIISTLSLLILTKNLLFATAGTVERRISAYAPTVEFRIADGDAEGAVTCKVGASVSKSDGTPVTTEDGLSVILLDEEGKTVAQSALGPVAESGDSEDAEAQMLAEVPLDMAGYDAVVTMRVISTDDDTDLDATGFNQEILGAVTQAKRALAGDMEPSPAEESQDMPATEQRPRYSDSDFSDTFIIGDSVLALSAREGGYGDKVSEHLPGVAYDVESGRYYDSDVAGDPDDGMIDIARRVAGKYDRYVIECGINDAGLTPTMAQSFVDTLLRDDVQIFFVNQRVIGGADDMTCATIRDIASRNERVYEVDWNSLCSGNEGAWLLDNCHPNADGADRLAGLIHDVMAEHASDVMVDVEIPSEGDDASGPGQPSAEGVDAVLAWQDSEDIVRADLRISTDAEIEGWGQRIDDYLAGTELAGYGHLFASMAATYQVDPRLSPAISTIESGNGAICAAPYNAWGWGGPGNWASWSSWEEAIEGHVSGLARNGYASMGAEECAMYCDWGYWDGDPSFCLKTEVLKI